MLPFYLKKEVVAKYVYVWSFSRQYFNIALIVTELITAFTLNVFESLNRWQPFHAYYIIIAITSK